jgi:signal transduction histidine kinase
VRAFESGGVDYITKPCKIEEIQARIDTHVSVRRLRKELEERYEELKKLETLRDKLTHMIVHDMRNPMSVVSGVIDFTLIDSKSELSESAEKMLKMGRSQSSVIIRMMDDMLEISLLEEGEMPVNRAECDLVELVNEAVESVSLWGQEMTVDLPASPCPVRCDGYLVRRILSNLIGNAVKFTQEGREIRVVARKGRNEFKVEVADAGLGIAPENHERIFRKFGKVDAVRPQDIPVAGLGLTFCRLAVEAHGGHLKLKSKIGEGSTFSFTIPMD